MAEKTNNWSQYVQQAAELMGLQITPAYFPDVVDNFERIVAIASLVTEFDLPENIESAPTFEP
ncbi:MAG: DUF4089 domain-containing protein [Xenococcaceae cyanobacterium MO_188.B32]|nr:DUF4089 domain-containing protein [Xenococcaceae cyanobacterium MO_188.B32]